MVVVKLAADGCYVDNGSMSAFVPAISAIALDTTGAGDTFAGAFLASILSGADILQAARAANHAAGRLVTGER
jgi:2-dehydro-3-deoxygluconokinase